MLISQEIPQQSIPKIRMKITDQIFHSNLAARGQRVKSRVFYIHTIPSESHFGDRSRENCNILKLPHFVSWSASTTGNRDTEDNCWTDGCNVNCWTDGCNVNCWTDGCNVNCWMDGCNVNCWTDGCNINCWTDGCNVNCWMDGCNVSIGWLSGVTGVRLAACTIKKNVSLYISTYLCLR